MPKKSNEPEKKKSLLEWLGGGLARKAGEELKGRPSKVEEEIRKAVDGSMRKKPKK